MHRDEQLPEKAEKNAEPTSAERFLTRIQPPVKRNAERDTMSMHRICTND
jgi:hypothetical protein